MNQEDKMWCLEKMFKRRIPVYLQGIFPPLSEWLFEQYRWEGEFLCSNLPAWADIYEAACVLHKIILAPKKPHPLDYC